VTRPLRRLNRRFALPVPGQQMFGVGIGGAEDENFEEAFLWVLR